MANIPGPKGSSPQLQKTLPNRGQRHRLAKHLQAVFKVSYRMALDMVDKLAPPVEPGPDPDTYQLTVADTGGGRPGFLTGFGALDPGTFEGVDVISLMVDSTFLGFTIDTDTLPLDPLYIEYTANGTLYQETTGNGNTGISAGQTSWLSGVGAQGQNDLAAEIGNTIPVIVRRAP